MLGFSPLSTAPVGSAPTVVAITCVVAGAAFAAFAATGSIQGNVTAPPSVITVDANGLADALFSAQGQAVCIVLDGPPPVVVPMVPWDLWAPYILPNAPGCPDAVMEFHVRQAAIEFCRFTRVWQSNLSTILGDGVSTNFTMQAPIGAEPGQLLTVTVVQGHLAPVSPIIVTPDSGLERINRGDLQPCAFTDGGSGLVVWPAQPSGARITPRSVLRPTQLAAECPEFLFAHYASEIAAGALATILSMSKQEWTDLKAAAISAGQFAGRKSSVSITVQRGIARATRQPATRWF